MHNKCRDVGILAERGREALEIWFALGDSVRLVLEVADGVASGLADVDGRVAEVTAAKVRELSALAADEIDPTLDRADDGVHVAIFGDGAAKVVGDEVAGVRVDVEAVGDVVAIEGEGLVIYHDGCELVSDWK